MQIPYILKEANFQLRFWEKKFRGLNICAKTLLFGILTLDKLFLKRCAAILIILVFLPNLTCENCKKCQFSTFNVSKIFAKNQIEEPYKDATCKI